MSCGNSIFGWFWQLENDKQKMKTNYPTLEVIYYTEIKLHPCVKWNENNNKLKLEILLYLSVLSFALWRNLKEVTVSFRDLLWTYDKFEGSISGFWSWVASLAAAQTLVSLFGTGRGSGAWRTNLINWRLIACGLWTGGVSRVKHRSVHNMPVSDIRWVDYGVYKSEL